MAGGLRFTVAILKGEFDLAMKGIYDPIAQAATDACVEVSLIGKAKARRVIGAAGFSTKWQNAMRADVYPEPPKASASAAVNFYHEIPYAGIFEEGAVIRGKPKLWVPLSSTPKKFGTKKIMPEVFQRGYGALFPMRIRGKQFLGAKLGVTKRDVKVGPPYKVTPARLRRGAAGTGKIIRTVPVFVGVDVVSIRKRFDLRSTWREAADSLPALYAKNLKD